MDAPWQLALRCAPRSISIMRSLHEVEFSPDAPFVSWAIPDNWTGSLPRFTADLQPRSRGPSIRTSFRKFALDTLGVYTCTASNLLFKLNHRSAAHYGKQTFDITMEAFSSVKCTSSVSRALSKLQFGVTIQPIEVWHGHGAIRALQLRITNHGQLKQVDTIVYNLINRSTVKVSRRSIPGAKCNQFDVITSCPRISALAIHVQICASDSSFRQKY